MDYRSDVQRVINQVIADAERTVAATVEKRRRAARTVTATELLLHEARDLRAIGSPSRLLAVYTGGGRGSGPARRCASEGEPPVSSRSDGLLSAVDQIR